MTSALLRLIAVLWVATTVALLCTLSACGGGGDPEPQSSTQPPDCAAHPEQCR